MSQLIEGLIMDKKYLAIGLFAASALSFGLSAAISMIKVGSNDFCKADLDGCVRFAVQSKMIDKA
jgi:hypothetical protein